MRPCGKWTATLVILAAASIYAAGAQNRTEIDGSEFGARLWRQRMSILDEYQLMAFWRQTRVNVTAGCDSDMRLYFGGIENDTAWATRMMDASGRYNGGLYRGNDQWLGSASVCRTLDEANLHEEEMAAAAFSHPHDLRNTTADATSFVVTYEKRIVYERDPSARFAVPPFRLLFSSVLLRLNISAAHNNGLYFVTKTLCLPKSCGAVDIRKIVTFAANLGAEKLSRAASVLKVRVLSGEYSIWDDKVFQMLSASIIIVAFFMLIGTGLDICRIIRTTSAAKSGDVTSSTSVASNENNNNDVPRHAGKKLDSVIVGHDSISQTSQQSVQEPGTVAKIFLAFAITANIKKICSPDIGDDTLAPIHGLRLFSFLWVVLVHTCLLMFQLSDNKRFRDVAEGDVLYQTVSNATYSVDTFFFISGVLVSFLFFRTMSKYSVKQLIHTDGFIAQVAMYLSLLGYRFIRLTPPYLVAIAISSLFTKYQKNNSVMEVPSLDHVNCDKYWWRNIIYINTFYSNEEMCMVWSWYLANDSQFYIIGSLILLLAVRHIRLATVTIVGLLVAAWSTTAIITVQTGYIPSIVDPFSHYDELYDKPWTRLGPYFVGIISGYILSVTNCQIRMSRWVVSVGWITSLSTLLALVYGLYYVQLDIYTAAIFVSVSHTIWSLAIAWVLFACVSGYGGPVTKILTWQFLYPFSRLAYCAYLIHPIVIKNVLLNSESPIHITREGVSIQFVGFVFSSLFVALIISLAFEAPVVALLHFTHPIKKKKITAQLNKGFHSTEE